MSPKENVFNIKVLTWKLVDQNKMLISQNVLSVS